MTHSTSAIDGVKSGVEVRHVNKLVRWIVFSVLIASLGFPLTQARAQDSANSDPDANYDRLDGTGQSGKTVQVIEWEGNLELHVYPPGSLRGLALKIDTSNKDKKVMVIGYRFADNPKQQLIRRAILGIDLQNGFKTFKDPTETEFDKIIISNNGLSGQVVSFALDPAPKQLYPDGHPALAQKDAAPGDSSSGSSSSGGSGNRRPASVSGSPSNSGPDVDDSGTIKPFFK